MATADESDTYLDDIDTSNIVENQEQEDDGPDNMTQEPITREIEIFENQRSSIAQTFKRI
jgi:hypothetical protein